MRKILATEEVPPISKILNKTSILQMIDRVLSFEHQEGDVYFMKLEAYWILQNLATGDLSDVKIIMGDD